MSTLGLLGWILAGLCVQLAAGIVHAVVGYRRTHPRHPLPVDPADSAGALSATHPSATAGRRPPLALRLVERRLEDALGTQCSFSFVAADGQPLPDFQPGQFLTFDLRFNGDGQLQRTQRPEGTPAGRAVTRCYSLSDRPGRSRLRITVKREPPPATPAGLPPGLVSNAFHDVLLVGDVLYAAAPAGDFRLDTASSVPVVLVAAGIGITPLLSMLLWMVDEQPGRQVDLFHACTHRDAEAFGSTLRELQHLHPHIRLHRVHSRPLPDEQPGRDHDATGRIDIALLKRSLPNPQREFYLCGPAGLLASLVPALLEWGVPEAAIHYEAFGPSSLPVPGAGAATGEVFAVRFARSARTLQWDGTCGSLLDFAEQHHVALPSGCRAGNCGACETRLLEGSARYPRNPAFTPAAAHCLPCVAVPASDITLDA